MTESNYIIRAPKDRDNPYVQIRRATAEDSNLSWAARGVLLYLLSKPDTWKIRVADLVKAGDCGRNKVYRIIKELETARYLEKHDAREGGRYAGTIWYLYEAPYPQIRDTVNGDTEPPYPQIRDTVSRDTVSRDTVSRYPVDGDRSNKGRIVKNHLSEESDHQQISVPMADGRLAETKMADDVQTDGRVSALIEKLHSVGVLTNPFIIDQYISLCEEGVPFEYVLRGITAAAENGNQHKFRYVEACIRNAAAGTKPKVKERMNGAHRESIAGDTEYDWRRGASDEEIARLEAFFRERKAEREAGDL